jgi:hypothetical protein
MGAIRIQPKIACLKPVALWTLAIALSAFPVGAQKGTPPSGGSAVPEERPGEGLLAGPARLQSSQESNPARSPECSSRRRIRFQKQ